MFINSLCTLPECAKRRSCAHLGPVGEHCFFEVEKELCELLNIQWKPDINIRNLLNEVRFRLSDKSLPDEIPAQFQPLNSIVPAEELKLKVSE